MAKFLYKDLLQDSDFLKCRLRARQLMRTGTDLLAIKYAERKLIFHTASGTYGRRVIWTQEVEITDAFLENIQNKEFKDVEDLIRNSGIKVYCNCLAKGTRILTKEGFKLIEEVSTGDQVLGSDSKWHSVIKCLKSTTKREWIALKAVGLRDPLYVSKEHKILYSTYRDECACGCGKKMRPVSDKYRLQQAYSLFNRRMFIPKHSKRQIGDNFKRYKLLSFNEYKKGYLLCSPKVKGTCQFDKDYARMLGYYLAEGSMQDRGRVVTITLNQNEVNTIAKDIKDYFIPRGVKVRFKYQRYKEQKWLIVIVYSKEFKDDCRHFCGRGSKTKYIHTDVLNWCDEAKESFIIGHLLGDGAVDDSFRWLSTSKNLVDMLQLLLNSLDIHASTYIADSARDRRSTCYAVSASVNSFFPVYKKYKSLFREKDQIELNNSRGQKNIDEYSLYKVTNITEIGVQEGYDLCLADEPHTYTANNVIVSNCPAFLFWGYKYMAWRRGYGIQRETRRPVVRNPHQRGRVCKHLYLVMSLFPFWIKPIAQKFKAWADSKEVKGTIRNLERARMNRQNREYVESLPSLGDEDLKEVQEIETELENYE